MEKAVNSLLPGGEEIEILIVDDGSSDGTARIADEYERRYPDQVRAIHQPNGGHGDAVMTGLKNATGLYFQGGRQRRLGGCGGLSEDSGNPSFPDGRARRYDDQQLCIRQGGGKAQTCGALSSRSAPGTRVRMGRDGPVPLGTVHPDAFRDLPDTVIAGLPPDAAKAYVLCGRAVCLSSPDACEKDVLSG